MTSFRRLEKKGWLLRLLAAPKTTYFYQSTRSRREVGEQMLDWVNNEFFDSDLINNPVKEESRI